MQTGIGEIYRRPPLADPAKAVAAYDAALAAHARLAEMEPDVDEHRTAQVELQRRLARIATEQRDPAGARRALDAALGQLKALQVRAPANGQAQLDTAETLVDLADLELAGARKDAARARLEEAGKVLAGRPPPAELAVDHERLVKRVRTRLKALGG